MKPIGVVSALAVLAACGHTAGASHTLLEYANWADYLEADLEYRVLSGFVEAHPGIAVQQQSAGAGQAEYRERILTSMVAGRPPDVLLLDNIDVPAFADRGVLLDLAPYLGHLGIDLTRYDSTVLAIFRRGPAIYALPRGYGPMMVVYNKDLFDRAAVPYPSDDWTWDDFLRVAKHLTRDTDGDGRVDQWGTAYDRRDFLWIPWVWSGGGDVLCADGTRASGCLDAPVSVEAIRWYTDWVVTDSIVPRVFNLRRSMGDNLRLFSSGKVAMLTVGHFWIPNIRPSVERGRLRVGFVEIPHRAGYPPQTEVFAAGLAVPRAAPHRKLSVELAAYLVDSLAQAMRAKAGLELPSLTAVAEELAAGDTLGWEAAFMRAARHGRAPWGSRIARWREVQAALPDMMDQITLDHRDPAVAARDMARRLDRLLEKGTVP